MLTTRGEFLGLCLAPFCAALGQSADESTLAEIIYQGRNDQPLIATTFDDGHFSGSIRQLLEICQREEIRLTFFPYAWPLQGDPGLWREVAAQGHDLQNHSTNHPLNIGHYSLEGVLSEIDGWQDTIDSILGYHRPAIFFRPPGGALSYNIRRAAALRGLTIALWSGSSGINNYDVQTAQADPATYRQQIDRTFGNIISASKPGAILLQHTNPLDATAFSAIVKNLKSRDLTPVTLAEVL